MVLASKRFSSSLASFLSSFSSSSSAPISSWSLVSRPMLGVRITIYLAFMIFTLS
jgi:hypothetical protein